jgi:NAD-dependent deacetylase
MTTSEQAIREIATWIRDARSVVVLTGAGVSAESGLSTFRDPEEGLWSKYDPMELATIDAFNRNPELVTRWYHWRFTRAIDVEPNPGHHALARIEQLKSNQGTGFTLITQNIDGLHQRGGSSNIVEIHGTILTWRCTITGEERPLSEIGFDSFPIPSDAGGLMRPCVVWFGEQLPESAIRASFEALSECDLFMSIGTSATVQPAASFIEVARENGAKTVEINRDPTPITDEVDLTVLGPSGLVLPEIVDALRELDGTGQ